MKRTTLVVALALLLSLLGALPAGAQSPSADSNPHAICAANPEIIDPATGQSLGFLRDFLATMGGCVSTLASVGLDGLIAGAFPSTAAAVGNCKELEATFFADPAEPNPGGPYPYQFYWFLGSDPDVFTAYNRADCLRFLEAFHTGQLAPPGE